MSRVARSGWSRIAYSIAGTIIVLVILNVSTASSHDAGVNVGSTTNEPPRSSTGIQNAPPAWLNGVQMRWTRRSGHCQSDIWIWVIAMPPRYVLITPLGRPVEPPV